MDTLFVLIFAQFCALTGAAGGLGVALPALVPVFGVVGCLMASGLASRDPARFANLGKGR